MRLCGELLPHGCQLAELQLKADETDHVEADGVDNYYHRCGVSLRRALSNAIGPCIEVEEFEGTRALAAAKDRARSVAEIQQMVKKGKLSFVLVDSHPGVVAGKAADRVVRVKETVRIVRGKDGRYAAQFERKSFDKKNRLVPHKESSGTNKQAWLLLIGVTGACWVLRRRATAPTTAAAPC